MFFAFLFSFPNIHTYTHTRARAHTHTHAHTRTWMPSVLSMLRVGTLPVTCTWMLWQLTLSKLATQSLNTTWRMKKKKDRRWERDRRDYERHGETRVDVSKAREKSITCSLLARVQRDGVDLALDLDGRAGAPAARVGREREGESEERKKK